MSDQDITWQEVARFKDDGTTAAVIVKRSSHYRPMYSILLGALIDGGHRFTSHILVRLCTVNGTVQVATEPSTYFALRERAIAFILQDSQQHEDRRRARIQT